MTTKKYVQVTAQVPVDAIETMLGQLGGRIDDPAQFRKWLDNPRFQRALAGDLVYAWILTLEDEGGFDGGLEEFKSMFPLKGAGIAEVDWDEEDY